MRIGEVNNRLKVAVLIRNYCRTSGGAEKYCVEITERIAKYHEVHLFAQSINFHSENIVIHKIPILLRRPRFLNQLLFSFFTYIKTAHKGFDIVHSHDMVTHANIYSLHVPTIKSSLIKLSLLKKITSFFSLRLQTYLWLERRLYKPKTAKRLIAVSKTLKENIVSSYPDSKELIDISFPGINFTESSSKKRNTKNSPLSSFKILFVGHSFKRKGLQIIVNAISQIKDKKIKIYVAGKGNAEEINTSNLGHNQEIEFLGEVSDIHELYQNSDLLIHPTLGDTFGMVVLEALYNKLPVIVSNDSYCGISHELSKEEVIFLDNPRNSFELKKAIIGVISDSRLRQKLKKNGFEFAKKFTWDNSEKEITKSYKKIIDR